MTTTKHHRAFAFLAEVVYTAARTGRCSAASDDSIPRVAWRRNAIGLSEICMKR